MRLAQLDRAFGYGPKGRGFESSNARKTLKKGRIYIVDTSFFVTPTLYFSDFSMENFMNSLFQLDGTILLWIQEFLRHDFMTDFWTMITSL